MNLRKNLALLLLSSSVLLVQPCAAARGAARPAQASLQAQAVSEVVQDSVRITLSVELSDASRSLVSEQLAKVFGQAADTARAQDQVKVFTGQYRVWPMTNRDGQISSWRGMAELVLESGHFDAASSLAATLGDTMAITSVHFFVSEAVRAEEEQKLMAQAARAFRDRAQALAQALGFSAYRLHEIELGGSGVQFEMMTRGVQAQAAMLKAPDGIPLEAGTETIRVSMNGRIWLLDETAPAR